MTSNEKIINDCVSPFNETQRAKLKALCKLQPKGSEYPPNAALGAYIDQLRALYPEMFHNKSTLKDRVFMDTPASIIPFARAVRTLDQSPHRIRIVPV
jgi:hypothetical protein